MRILSQKSQESYYDIPYERVCLSVLPIYSGQYRIFIYSPSNTPGTAQIMATYSSKQKADKVIQMLQEAYAPQIQFKWEESNEKEIPQINSSLWVMKDTPTQTPNIQVFDNFYFQFPEDSEVEV